MQKVLFSLKNACIGLRHCFCTQRNMVVHAVIGAVVLLTAFYLHIPLTGMLFLLTAIMAVMVTEVLNTALEQVIDLFTTERNYFAQKAKDLAAGAVLLTSLFAVVVGLCILGPPLLELFRDFLLLY